MELMEAAREYGHIPMRRCLTYAAGLALRQGHVDVVLSILNNCRQEHYVTVRSLKILAYVQLGRFEDALAIVRSVIDYDGVMERKLTFPKNLVRKHLIKSATVNNYSPFNSTFSSIPLEQQSKNRTTKNL